MTRHTVACQEAHLYAVVQPSDRGWRVVALTWDRALLATGTERGPAGAELWEVRGAQRTLLEHLLAGVIERMGEPGTAHRLVAREGCQRLTPEGASLRVSR